MPCSKGCTKTKHFTFIYLFYPEGIETFEVEDFLEDVLNTEFDLILEDNSISEVGPHIIIYW